MVGCASEWGKSFQGIFDIRKLLKQKELIGI
jgi:hypothetical protein